MRHALPRVPLHHSFQSVNQIEALFVVFFFKRQSYLFFLIYAIIIYSDFVLSRFFVLFWLRFELKLYPSFTDLKGDGALIYPLFSFTLPIIYILRVNQVWRKSSQRVGARGLKPGHGGACPCGAVACSHASPSACPSRDAAFPGQCRAPDGRLPAFNPNRSLGNRKLLRTNCRTVQCTGKNPAPCLVQPARPAPWSGSVYPPPRRWAVQSCIVIVSLWHRYPT